MPYIIQFPGSDGVDYNRALLLWYSQSFLRPPFPPEAFRVKGVFTIVFLWREKKGSFLNDLKRENSNTYP